MEKTTGRRRFMQSLLGAAAAPYAAHAMQAASASPAGHARKPQGRLAPFDYQDVRLLDGMLKKQFTATRNYFYDIPDDDLLKGFRARAGLPAPGRDLGGWYSGAGNGGGGEVWAGGDFYHAFGQYLSGMARMSRAANDQALHAKAVRLMTEWGKTIEPDGYFFYSRHPNDPHYIYDKMVCGLVDLYQYGGRKDALGYLDKITGWAVQNLNRDHRHGEWYTLSENIYRAYEATGDAKYKNFADVWRYTEYWKAFAGGSEMPRNGHHAYSHVNTLSSAAMAYQVTGDSGYLRTIVNAYDWLERTQFYPTGGYGPDETLVPGRGGIGPPSLGRALQTTGKSFETVCCSWAGFKLAHYLFRFTGRARYGDWVEKLAYNGVGAALPLGPHGETFCYSDYRLGGGRKLYFDQGTYTCCSGTLPQAVADYYNLVYFKDAASLYVNLFVPSSVTWNHRGTEVRVEQETGFPESDSTSLAVRPSREDHFAIKFRVPRWTQNVKVRVNGAGLPVRCEPGAWAAIERRWKDGDRVTIQLPMRLALAPVDDLHPHRVALQYGPVVLVRDQQAVLRAQAGELSDWISRPAKALEFEAAGQKQGPFVPFYRLGFGTPYNMFFDLTA